MSEDEPTTGKSREPQVFLSYASEDRAVAERIATRLKSGGAKVFTDRYELKVGDSLISRMETALSASDYVVVLLSPHSVRSKWVQRELDTAYSRYMDDRAVTLLPVLIEDCEIPPPLSLLQYLDLRTNIDEGINQLARTLGAASKIDFSRLSPRAFEQLVADLFSELGFKIEAVPTGKDGGIDIVAMSPAPDPFGPRQPQRWLVQVKHYQHGRADLKSVHELVARLDKAGDPTTGVVVTTGQFTSAVQEWVHDQVERGVRLELVDGTALKRLLLKHPDVARRHFEDVR
jgi:HJR/Mrr/RecB family endonuclease